MVRGQACKYLQGEELKGCRAGDCLNWSQIEVKLLFIDQIPCDDAVYLCYSFELALGRIWRGGLANCNYD